MNMTRIEKTLAGNCPIGLLAEYDLMDRQPARRKEIIAQAILVRADSKLTLKETLHVYTWHPLHTVKNMLLMGLIVFELIMLVSAVSALGHWYAQAKSTSVAVPLPLGQFIKLDVGSYLPSSDYLAVLQKFPTFTWQEAVYGAFAGMLLVLLERVLIMTFHREKVQRLRYAIKQSDEEVALLEKWRSGD